MARVLDLPSTCTCGSNCLLENRQNNEPERGGPVGVKRQEEGIKIRTNTPSQMQYTYQPSHCTADTFGTFAETASLLNKFSSCLNFIIKKSIIKKQDNHELFALKKGIIRV